MENSTNVLVTGVVTVVGGLAAAVTTLWKMAETKNAKRIEQLEQRAQACEDDREDLRVRVAKMEVHLGQQEDAH